MPPKRKARRTQETATAPTSPERTASSSPLDGFIFERVLSEASLLGHYGSGDQAEKAVINLEKTHFAPSFYENLGSGTSAEGQTLSGSSLAAVADIGANDVYRWILGWMPAAGADVGTSASAQDRDNAHVKLTVIRPATEAHIKKYSVQSKVLIRETKEMFDPFIKDFIKEQGKEKVQWVYNILDKKSEAESILYEDPHAKRGFIIVPDLKWDRRTLSSLYLIAIVKDRSLKSLRDLKKSHIPMLENILEQAERVADEKLGLRDEEFLGFSKVRLFIHYHPSYYHLHVHILSADYTSHPGAIVGQAHLLEDVIDLLRQGVDFKKRVLTYHLGTDTDLYRDISVRASMRVAWENAAEDDENFYEMGEYEAIEGMRPDGTWEPDATPTF